jgi:hypothetical protein
MAPITLKLEEVLQEYETVVQPAVALLAPNGYGLWLVFVYFFDAVSSCQG